MKRTDSPTVHMPAQQHFLLRELVPHQGVNYDAWTKLFEEYLAAEIHQHEDELLPNVPARALSGPEFFRLLILAARCGATAGFAALETLRPPEPPI